MGDDGGGDKTDAKTVAVQGLLTASGGYGLSHWSKLIFATPAFSISLISGLVGLLTNVTENSSLADINYYTRGLARTFVLPLVASEVCFGCGNRKEIAALNLLYPTIFYIGKYLLENQDLANQDFLDVSHALSAIAIGYYSFIGPSEYGMLMAFTYALSSLGRNVLDNVQDLIGMLAISNFIYMLKVL